MTDNNHPITPPEELVRLWLENYFGCWDDVNVTVADASSYIATQTSQWIHEQRGASNEAEVQKARDEELEACINAILEHPGFENPELFVELLRTARRPLSLKEQALKELKDWTDEKHGPGGEVFLCEGLSVALIREALESLSS